MVRHLSYMQFYVGSNPTWWTKVRYFMSKYQNLLRHQKTTKERVVWVMGEKCQICGYDKCFKALELHHIDSSEKEKNISGNMLNVAWDIMSLELKKCILLCANCHREVHDSSTYPILNSSFNEERNLLVSNLIKDIKTKKLFYCKNCGILIDVNNKYCIECGMALKRKVIRPSREELKKLIREKTFVGIAKQYEVTDNAIRKWCVSENLPKTKKEINQYNDIEWGKI